MKTLLSAFARWNPDVTINGGEMPIASFVTQNFSNKLL